MKKKIEEIIWRLMVGCAKGQIEPNQKKEYTDQILLAINEWIDKWQKKCAEADGVIGGITVLHEMKAELKEV